SPLNVGEAAAVEEFDSRFEVVSVPVFGTLSEMVVDMLESRRAVLRVPAVRDARRKIGCRWPIAVINERPFCVGDAERQGSARHEHPEAFAEQLSDWFRVVEVLEAML